MCFITMNFRFLLLVLTNRLKVPLVFLALSTVIGCGNYGYKVGKDKVVYSLWDGSKEAKYTLEDADANSFRILLQSQFGVDERNVYRRQYSIPGADANTFKLINRWHAVDANYGYHDGILIPNSNAASFESLSSTFSKDDSDVYIGISSIDACHSPSYNLLINFWAKDKECAYAGFNKIDGAHPDSFEGLNRFYAKDKNKVYAFLYRNIDQEKRSSLSAAEKNRLDEGGTGSLLLVYIVAGANARTFEVLPDNPIYGKDNNQCFKYDKPIACADIEER